MSHHASEPPLTGELCLECFPHPRHVVVWDRRPDPGTGFGARVLQTWQCPKDPRGVVVADEEAGEVHRSTTFDDPAPERLTLQQRVSQLQPGGCTALGHRSHSHYRRLLRSLRPWWHGRRRGPGSDS